MRRASTWTVTARAIIGVIALYGLLLQGFLAAAMPAGMLDLAGVICAPHDGAGSNSPDKPLRHQHDCCTAAQVGPIGPPPASPAALAWAFPVSQAVIWRAEASIPKTGPPTHAHSARGPPSA